MSRRLGIAGLQLKKDPYDPEANLEKLEKNVKRVRSLWPWVDLIFTGELYLHPYEVTSYKDLAEPIPNSLTDKLGEIAAETERWFVPGSLYERDGSRIYNTAIAINPKGEIVAKHRKLFPWKPSEGADYGEEFAVFEIPGIAKVGLAICYDLWFPEIFRTLTWMGADVVLQPSATYTPDRPAELILTQAQAIMHQCYVLNANVVSPAGGGLSIFSDPEGRILQQVGTHEEVMTEVLDIDKVAWVRQNGSFGITAVWKSFRDSPLDGKFPVYERLKEGEIMKQLGEFKVQKSIREWKV
ncbi:MAG: carbon-nitrogen hydrolase family protein [Promethearchaeota archaeon]